MLSKAQEKLIRSLHTKKGREKHGRCLLEGEKVLETAGNAVELRFTVADTELFHELVTTETPQTVAGIARTPEWSIEDVASHDVVVVLDGVQDPGNVGALLRLCLGFNASLLLVDSVDVTNSKVVRSSVGALFQVPWVRVSRNDASAVISQLNRPIYRLEKRPDAVALSTVEEGRCVLIAGSEGNGIQLPIGDTSLFIPHQEALESLNVAQAVCIALYHFYSIPN